MNIYLEFFFFFTPAPTSLKSWVRPCFYSLYNILLSKKEHML